MLRADDLALDDLTDVAEVVVEVVGGRRATWKRWNLHAEAVRQTMGLRFASTADRDAVVGMIVDAAERASLQLTPGELASTPAVFLQRDGSSAFRPKASLVYTSEKMLAAEDRLLAASSQRTAPTLPIALVDHVAQKPGPSGHTLSTEQQQAVAKIAVSGRTLDLLVGPAGTGKTTTMSGLHRAWERAHGRGSVIGLAPSAVAAEVLATDLGISTENTAKWLHEHHHGRWNLTANQLVIIDEASLAGTLALDAITAHAAEAGAKVLLVGDWGQLTAVDAGGAFGMLVRDRGDAPQLMDVRRFRNDWEKQASLALRIGDTDVIDTYINNDRIIHGAYETILDQSYGAWLTDRAAGLTSVLIAETLDTVADLNARARTDRIVAGEVAPDGLRLHDGNEASAGDIVITRRNDRRLSLGRGWVKNGDRWIVTATNNDGSLTARREKSKWRTTITLPAAYVATDLELGYAITTHRAEGSTLDTGHAIVHSPEMTREALYVSGTRGREANHIYVATDQHHLEEHQHRDDLTMTARSILYGILQHEGAEKSAHETIRAEQDTWGSLWQLAAEHETIANEAQQQRWITLCEEGGLTAEQIDDLIDSESFGILATELRRLEAAGHRIDALLPRVIRAGRLNEVEDLGSLLRYRVTTVAAAYPPVKSPEAGLIAGLIPRAIGITDDDMARALTGREELITKRAAAQTRLALEQREPWIETLNPRLSPPELLAQMELIVAYRDRWGITATSPLGTIPDDDAQRIDYKRAQVHLKTSSTQKAPVERAKQSQSRISQRAF
ncbi:ATP-dependent DNA helicase [Leucobacter insecticola]|uniref:ATP-dependent DNA helicase n=1 Tax=Leucobacter insecticola TaxID=2714934 RepID=UPI001FCBC714|nr:AAA family ATPase [Leucobacter insecticola]